MLLATRSAGKVHELLPLFAAAGIDLQHLGEIGIPETSEEQTLESADTFEQNALLKARHFHRLTGMPTVSDDSGIEALGLDRAPGVHSKRWSGRLDLHGQALDDANNALLLERLGPGVDRRACYVCAAAFSDGDEEFVERGEVEGVITLVPRGRSGFGYDPYFESLELGRTFGEVTREEKARVSHRARAFAKLLRRLVSAALH